MIKKILLLFVITILTSSVFGQKKIVVGRIYNNANQPLIGVVLCQANSENCNFSDSDGVFHILINPENGNKLDFSYLGYKPVSIVLIDTIRKPLLIIMESDSSLIVSDNKKIENSKIRFGFETSLQADMTKNNFTDFESVLGSYNTDLMNKSNGIFSCEIAFTYKGYFYGLNYGFANDYDYKHDSLDITFKTNQFGLHFGYNLIDSKRIRFTPKVSLKWNRYRIINSDKDRRIPIEQYVSERDLDVRFNQTTGFVGFNLAFKIHKLRFLYFDYWTIGLYGGYIVKLNDKPWVYSKNNRLSTDKKINMESYNFGINFGFNLDSK